MNRMVLASMIVPVTFVGVLGGVVSVDERVVNTAVLYVVDSL